MKKENKNFIHNKLAVTLRPAVVKHRRVYTRAQVSRERRRSGSVTARFGIRVNFTAKTPMCHIQMSSSLLSRCVFKLLLKTSTKTGVNDELTSVVCNATFSDSYLGTNNTDS